MATSARLTAVLPKPIAAQQAQIVSLPASHDDLLRVDPGEYLAVYAGHAVVKIFRSTKLRLDFRLLAHPDVVLPRWYRIVSHHSGRIEAGKHSDLVREVSSALGVRVRHDRVALGILAGRALRVCVRYVSEDRKQKPLAVMNRYSVVSSLLGCEI
jgi:hypothetical protein